MVNFNKNIAIKLPREIYFNNLQIINEVTFTSREIDIIACILQGRTAKKIAFLLRIAPKTVENHLRNIMLKINCSSKEKIIDFIEKSGKFNYIKYYYSSLIIKLAFESELKQLLQMQKQQPIGCTIIHHNLVDEQLKLLQQLLEHLKIINVETSWLETKNPIDVTPLTINPNEYILYCISKDVNEHIKKIEGKSTPWFVKQKRVILLLLQDYHNIEKLLQTCNKVDLTATQNYYLATFSMLKLLFPSIDFSNSISSFEQSCVNLVISEQMLQNTTVTNNYYDSSVVNINRFSENHLNVPSIYMEQTINDKKSYHADAANKGANEFKKFLQLAADGEQDLAEQLLQQNPNFAVKKGDVTDLSKRSFTEITAFQYALWSLDWNMWSTLEKYIPIKVIYSQVEDFHKNILQQYGKHAGIIDGPILAVILSLEKYIKLCKNEANTSEACEYWNQQVGKSQLMLPAHVVNEYCSRSWGAEKNVRHKMFVTLGSIQRNRNVYINGLLEEWYGAYNNKLGICFAYMRHSFEYPEGQDAFGIEMPLGEFGGRRVRHDLEVLKNLHDVRTKQFFAFISKYI